MNIKRQSTSGFSIVELVIVIIIIGILSALVFVSYDNIQAKVNDNSVLSDVEKMNSLQMKYGYANDTEGKTYSGGYDSELGFTPSGGNTISVLANDGMGYCIRGYNANGTKNSIENAYTKESAPGACDQLTLSCPTGFIVVPGSPTYDTSAFCVMKYEAKNNGSGVAISQATTFPWASITQPSAITVSAAACTGCHLIEEDEWMTIAENVLSVPSNWSSETVGTGYIYSGHNDNSTVGSLEASDDTNDGYIGTGNFAGDTSILNGMTGNSQRRKLTLTNGEVIWDLAGNVEEWTQGVIAANTQPGKSGECCYVPKEWNDGLLVLAGRGLPASSTPDSIDIAGANDWHSHQGIGQLYSKYDETTDHVYKRGGYHNSNSFAGVLELSFENTSGYSCGLIGFRVAMTP